jgi:hypothetical protein
VRHQPKWRAKSVDSSTTDPWISLSDLTTEEEVIHPIDRDRAKAASQKEKGKGKTQIVKESLPPQWMI